MSAPRVAIEDRFWSKVDKSDSCWEWMGGRNAKGYGWIVVSGSRAKKMAHRVAYELTQGAVPDELVIDHLCHNPPCVNPAHLRATTVKINCENRKGANGNNRSSGVRGVSWHKRDRKWHVRAQHFGRMHYAGAFDDLAEAEAAARALRSELYGDAA